MSKFVCDFCGGEYKSKVNLNIHKEKTKSCIALQIKKLGKPFSEFNKEKKALEETKNIKKQEKKTPEEEVKNQCPVIVNCEPVDNTLSLEDEFEEEIDENAEIPLTSSSDDESSSSDEEPYKLTELSTVKEVFDNIENYQRTNPSRLNNLFKKKSSTVKTEIITDDQPLEVHKRKIEEYLPSKDMEKNPNKEISSTNDGKLQKEISKLIEDKITHFETKFMKTVNNLDVKMNSILEIIGKLEDINEKKMKSIENKLERGNIKDIERVIDEKLDDMFSITRKMLVEVESKSELLDIFRENMEDIVDKHYDLYKKFKYVKEDIEDMVYNKRR